MTMAPLHILFLIFHFLFFSASFAANSKAAPPPDSGAKTSTAAPAIQKACKATRYPDICVSSFSADSHSVKDPNALQIIKSAISFSARDTKTAQTMVTGLLRAAAGSNKNLSVIATSCLEVLANSDYRLQSTVEALPTGKTKDARAYMSAALSYHYGCYSGFKNVDDTDAVHKAMSFLLHLTNLTSNALSLVRSFDLFGNNIDSWASPKTEREEFFEPAKKASKGIATKFPANLKVDAVVSKDGSGQYKTVQEAVDAVPNNLSGKKFVINIKAGTYDEIVRIPYEKKNVVFLGDGMGKTIITGALTVGVVGVFTSNTPTVGVYGDGFMMKDLTIQNTAGAPTHQAVAFRSGSDKSYIENCEFKGHQDTLYVHGLRQYYKSCRIEGNVDFIFGNAAAYFQDCKIYINPRLEDPKKGEKNAVTAHGRTDPGQSTGLVFNNCSVSGTHEYLKLYHSNPKVHLNYLGRPWKDYSKAVYINCFLDDVIAPAGWLEWNGEQSLDTLYFAEYQSTGPGAKSADRQKWSSQITAQQVSSFSVENFIQGDEWLPTS